MHKELYQRTFGDILKAAVEENLMASLETIPSNEVLQAEYVPSSVLWNRIRKIVRKDHRRTLWRKAMQSTKKVAILLAIIIPVSLGSLLSVEASRTAILNFIFNWKSDHVDIHFQQAGSSPSAQSPQNAAIPEQTAQLPEKLRDALTSSVFTNMMWIPEPDVLFSDTSDAYADTLTENRSIAAIAKDTNFLFTAYPSFFLCIFTFCYIND